MGGAGGALERTALLQDHLPERSTSSHAAALRLSASLLRRKRSWHGAHRFTLQSRFVPPDEEEQPHPNRERQPQTRRPDRPSKLVDAVTEGIRPHPEKPRPKRPACNIED